jgi:poly-beta-1,6-N-acetyl-D-glucosamine synthase
VTISIEELSYILITPARNEEEFIGRTIEAVIAQTVLPTRWVIVSDGSTDRTDEIVQSYQAEHKWIEFVRAPGHQERHFAAKVNCFNTGYKKIRAIDYQIIGNLDADISFESDYFEFLLKQFAEFSKLGVAGTPFVEDGSHYDYRFTNIEHVSGACQLFRRECFEDIGGYTPIKGGGIDWVAVTTARMKGWKTRTFLEKTCIHHRRMGTAKNNVLMICFKNGQKNYFLGWHPLWQLFRSCYQMKNRPYIIGGLLLFGGYIWGAVNGAEKAIPRDLIQFHRSEQISRLKSLGLRLLAPTTRIRKNESPIRKEH